MQIHSQHPKLIAVMCAYHLKIVHCAEQTSFDIYVRIIEKYKYFVAKAKVEKQFSIFPSEVSPIHDLELKTL